MPAGTPGAVRLAGSLERQIRDAGFQGLFIDTVTSSGETCSFRLLPPSCPEANPLFRLIPTGGTPRRLRLDAAVSTVRQALTGASSGAAFSSTDRVGLAARFGPEGLDLSFPDPAAVRPAIAPRGESGPRRPRRPSPVCRRL